MEAAEDDEVVEEAQATRKTSSFSLWYGGEGKYIMKNNTAGSREPAGGGKTEGDWGLAPTRLLLY
jgi:hypothetical protein